MLRPLHAFFALYTLFAGLLANAQVSSPGLTPPDYSNEAAIIESMASKISFDNQGNSTREQVTRVKVQTDGGVQHWGILNLPFQSATQVVDIEYVRVTKTDGSTVITPPDNVQDLDAEITRSAPFYSDLREKHIAVKGLAKGDTLEYKARWQTTKPLAPGQFWFAYNFFREGIVLNERLEISVPADRPVKVKGPIDSQTVSTEKSSRIYAWTHSNLQSTKDPAVEEKHLIDAARGRLPAPNVQISSFQTWDEVGRWFWNLQADRIVPTDSIKAKAAELTKGMTDDAAKLQAIYAFVSLQYRYIGIAFGIGRYQPHFADDVLSNNYGDCKDKHTLLASLLQASGIKIYPALMSSSISLEPEVPSPAQFDHMIGYLPPAGGKDAIWLDTTPEVAPLGLLAPPLRDKPALVMLDGKSAQLITTPADPLVPGNVLFKVDAKLNSDGTLDAKMEDTAAGEIGAYLKAAFRRAPRSQWKELVQGISYALGYSGTVSDITANSAEEISDSFHFAYSYNRKDYPDWSNHRFFVPGLPFLVQELKDDAKGPVWLGSPHQVKSESRVELPQGYKPELPSNVDLVYDFAEYHATYSLEEGALVAKRRAVFKLHEVPPTKLGDYRKFTKGIQDDANQYVQTTSASSDALSMSRGTDGFGRISTYTPFQEETQALPDSNVLEANHLEQDGLEAINQHDVARAEYSFKTAVAKDAKFTRGWLRLGIFYVGMGVSTEVTSAFRKAVENDPSRPLCYRYLAYDLMSVRKNDEAIQVWQDLLRLVPADQDATSKLALLLIWQKRYPEALPYAEAAAKVDDFAPAQYRLGVAYLHTGKTEEAGKVFAKLVEANPTPANLNNIAYELADANAVLPRALDYAQRAVQGQEKLLQAVKLDDLKREDPGETEKIGFYWDTLGWAHFRMGHLEEAQRLSECRMDAGAVIAFRRSSGPGL